MRGIAYIAGTAAVSLVPYFAGIYWTSLIIQILVFGLLALSVDLLIAHTGMLPMGHAGFFAVAAYTVAILEVHYTRGFIVSAFLGVLFAALFGVVFGLAVRTSGVYFILLTLSLGHIVWGVAMRWTALSGGENGISNIPAPAIGAIALNDLRAYYYCVVTMVLISCIAYRKLIRSPFGLALRGIRYSESRMRGLGYDVFAHKIAAFALSATLAGCAGVLYIYWNRLVSPATATFLVSAEAVLMVIIGGSGTLLGPFLGAAVLLLVKNYGTAYFADWWMMAIGAVFIATVLWAPGGLLGLMRRMINVIAERRSAQRVLRWVIRISAERAATKECSR